MTREDILSIAKPILLNTDMVRAILDGRKSVTRRVVKGLENLDVYRAEPTEESLESGDLRAWEFTYGFCDNNAFYDGYKHVRCPYRIDDYLYIRETWREHSPGFPHMYIYKADYPVEYEMKIRWRPSIHMPKEAARIFLRVTDVRVEQLQDITIDDVLREGVSGVEPPPICIKGAREPEGFRSWSKDKQDDWIKSTATATYIGWCDYADKLFYKMEYLWNSTIKEEDLSKYGWDANPWVWVIEFERVEV